MRATLLVCRGVRQSGLLSQVRTYVWISTTIQTSPAPTVSNRIGQTCVNNAFRDCTNGCAMPADRSSSCTSTDYSPLSPDPPPLGSPPPDSPLPDPPFNPRDTPIALPPPRPPPSAPVNSSVIPFVPTASTTPPASKAQWWRTSYAKIGAGVVAAVLFLCIVACVARGSPVAQAASPVRRWYTLIL